MPPATNKQRTFPNGNPTRPHPEETPDPYTTNLPQRFTAKIRVDNNTGCWNWTGAKSFAGYGRFGNNGGRKATPRVVMAHRFAFEQTIGRLPKRLHLDHLCRNPACVNPWHLEPVTMSENVRRGNASNARERYRREHEAPEARWRATA